MKSRLDFTKYLTNTLLKCKHPSEYFFYTLSKLRVKELYPIVEIWLSNEHIQITLLRALYAVLHKTFNSESKITGSFIHWGEIDTELITEIITEKIDEDMTYLHHICRPLYGFIIEEGDSAYLHDEYRVMLRVKREDVIKSVVNFLRDFTTNCLRRLDHLQKSFNTVNRSYCWRREVVYR